MELVAWVWADLQFPGSFVDTVCYFVYVRHVCWWSFLSYGVEILAFSHEYLDIPITVSAFYRLADTLDWLYCYFSLSLCLSLTGAEGQQKALHVSAFCGTYSGRLCHKSCLHLGGSAGAQRVPTPWPADGASQCHPAQVQHSGPQPHAASAGRRWEEGESLSKCILFFSVLMKSL